MIIIAGTMEFTRECFAEAREAASRVTLKSRQESGCLAYRFSQDLTEECMLNFYEEWDSPQALAEHKATAHYMAFKRALERFAPMTRRAKTYQADPLTKA